jgi:predicted nucleic acid-binding protein
LKRYLLDTNHLSAYLDGRQILQPRVDAALQSGDRFGICLPIHCEYRAGIRLSKRYRQNLARLQTALTIIRVWLLMRIQLSNSLTLFMSFDPLAEQCRSSIC